MPVLAIVAMDLAEENLISQKMVGAIAIQRSLLPQKDLLVVPSLNY